MIFQQMNADPAHIVARLTKPFARLSVALGIEPAYPVIHVLGAPAGDLFGTPDWGNCRSIHADFCAIGGWTA